MSEKLTGLDALSLKVADSAGRVSCAGFAEAACKAAMLAAQLLPCDAWSWRYRCETLLLRVARGAKGGGTVVSGQDRMLKMLCRVT